EALKVPGDPAPPATLPKRGFGGAAGRRSNRTRISMSKSSKPRASAMPAPTTGSSAQQRNKSQGKNAGRTTKQSRIIAMLRSPSGVSIDAMIKASGWQQHSVRGFLAGVIRKRLKLKLTSKVIADKRIYRIVGSKAGGSKTLSAVDASR
ncbi:MAG: DUF3489 domain-containing protein, partial [Pseudorhodoplanes sp.]